MTQQTIDIVSPIPARESRRTRVALRRFVKLDGRRVGLLDNNKPNADRFLGCLGALLEERYHVQVVAKRKMSRTEADCLPELIEGCDFVINAFAD
jgi:hypothetical protein